MMLWNTMKKLCCQSRVGQGLAGQVGQGRLGQEIMVFKAPFTGQMPPMFPLLPTLCQREKKGSGWCARIITETHNTLSTGQSYVFNDCQFTEEFKLTVPHRIRQVTYTMHHIPMLGMMRLSRLEMRADGTRRSAKFGIMYTSTACVRQDGVRTRQRVNARTFGCNT